MLGYIGMAILLCAYLVLLTKKDKWFVPIDIIASGILTIHAFNIADVPFMVVNGFITMMLIIKYIKDRGVITSNK